METVKVPDFNQNLKTGEVQMEGGTQRFRGNSSSRTSLMYCKKSGGQRMRGAQEAMQAADTNESAALLRCKLNKGIYFLFECIL